jgi:cardiolipin synthase C
MIKKSIGALLLLAAGVLTACSNDGYKSATTSVTGQLSDETLLRHATGGALQFSSARIITGNDAAFRSKLDLINGAKTSIDAMYYIYGDDYSSSVLSEALLAAARRGVKIRLLLDYHTNYKNLDFFTMLEKKSSAGPGSLQVRFYNRPTLEIVKDAVYLTMGCGKDAALSNAGCGAAKIAEIERLFADETIDGRPAAALNISNLNISNSGLFLSGLYAKNAALMAHAVQSGQGIDPNSLMQGGTSASPEDTQNLKKIARVYWASRTGSPFSRLTARIQLGLAFALYGNVLDPIYNSFTAYLPAERKRSETGKRDVEFLTDFLHHKLLLADGARMQLGGRNVEDAYHMRQNAMLGKYMFMDTDLVADVGPSGQAVQASFDRLWNFRSMVASTAEILSHAPNDYAAQEPVLKQAAKKCAAAGRETAIELCVNREVEKVAGRGTREEQRFKTMKERAAFYRSSYRFVKAPNSEPTFTVDPSALLAYIENLPFAGNFGSPAMGRSVGSKDGREAGSGKKIHALWLAGLDNACNTATAKAPKRVILHNAYFFPPANLMKQFARMIDGSLDCRHVTVTVLTNSLATTDLKVVNMFARHTAKAFAEFYQARRDKAWGARFEYFEYVAPPADIAAERAQLSLHSKVSLLGEDMIVGSANADLRSYLMDTNNGVLIRGAQKLVAQYTKFFSALLADKSRTQIVTGYFATTSRDVMIKEDIEVLRAEIKRYGADRWIDEKKAKDIERRMVEMLNRAYELAKSILAGGAGAVGDAAAFNRLFKPI